MPNTVIADLIDPEVMADMISAELPNAIRFTGVAPIDNTLQGQPGTTITVPKYEYIGDAVDVAEGAAIDYTKMSTTTQQATVKKAAKGVALTDEAVLSGYGDPIGEATRQITMAIASKVDNDIVDVAKAAPLVVEAAIGVDMIDTIEAAFDDENETTGVLFMEPSDASILRKEAADAWTRASDLGDDILVRGAFGECLGWQIVRSGKVAKGAPLAVKSGAMTTYMKRALMAESARDIDHKLTKFNADEHYVVALTDDTKIVRVTPPTP